MDITDECWLFAGQLRKGYGIINRTVNGKPKHFNAHRTMYENMVGKIPDGIVCDHLCRVRHCINPAHIELVTNAENIRRGMSGVLKTHCKQGHAYTVENTAPIPNTKWRRCKECSRVRARRNYKLRMLSK